MSAFKNFKNYNRDELLKAISGIDITEQNNVVTTKYFGVLKSVSKVSDRYEVFDIKSFLNEKIDAISKNFDIKLYHFNVRRGIQMLTLVSDAININGVDFYKSFFILNSSDRSRRLSLNLGLYNNTTDFYLVSSVKNASLYKKHLTGITQIAEAQSESIDGETFTEQIDNLKSLVGEKVMLSKVRDIIVEDDSVKINHKKFDAFKNQLLWNCRIVLTKEQEKVLRTRSEDVVFNANNDISLDAFVVFQLYMRIFNRQDSHVVKKETDRIFQITKCFIRQERLRELFFEM